jgi:hypothetical protein
MGLALSPAGSSASTLGGKYFWFWSSKNKNALSSLAFRSFDLPVKISEALDTSRSRGSSPKRWRRVAWLRYGSFCKKAALRQPQM